MSRSNATCLMCRYWWASDPPHRDGTCCRYAPRPRTYTRDEMGSDELQDGHRPLWPLTYHNEWCGEWAPREPVAAVERGPGPEDGSGATQPDR